MENSMSLAYIALNQIIVMFLIIIVGIISYKFKLIDKESNKKLSDLLLMLVNPLVIFVSYQRDFSKELLNGLMISFLLAIITHVFGIFISYIVLRGKNNPDVVIERFSSIYSNCGFMGIPLVNGIFGGEGVFFITAYMTIFNLFIWTQGLIMMVGKQDKKTMLKTLISPTLIAIVLGVIFFILQIRVPDIVFKTADYVASMNTPLAMMIAGVTIAQTDIRKVFAKIRIYLVVIVKLLLIPGILLIIYSRFPIHKTVITTAILAAACPTAATGTLFALKYNKNALYASEIFAITTVASMATIPLIMALTELIL
jgi:malate permease and related proteins